MTSKNYFKCSKVTLQFQQVTLAVKIEKKFERQEELEPHVFETSERQYEMKITDDICVSRKSRAKNFREYFFSSFTFNARGKEPRDCFTVLRVSVQTNRTKISRTRNAREELCLATRSVHLITSAARIYGFRFRYVTRPFKSVAHSTDPRSNCNHLFALRVRRIRLHEPVTRICLNADKVLRPSSTVVN